MPSRSGRSTARRSRPRARRERPRVDVYLFPAVVGGGLGDIEETLAAGRELARAGFGLRFYRARGRSGPRSVDGPWDWPPIVRTDRIAGRSPAALTITPAWGVSAAPARDGAYGRGGAWAAEAADVERAYGAASTLHVSLEEFARTLTGAEEDRERFREGGVRSRAIGRRLTESVRSGDRATLSSAFARFRAFDRPNVLHLFATLRRDAAFARAFPAAVQTGPLWPRAYRAAPRPTQPEWVWYASPASAEAIAPGVASGLGRSGRPLRLIVRTDRRWIHPPAGRSLEILEGRLPSPVWRRRFAGAELRIVTGSRTLLEALELGGPFLYFNGTLGEGPARRRHRPEKLDELLRLLRARRSAPDLVRDLADFGRGRRVAEVVARAARREGGWARFPRRIRPVGFRPPYDDAGRLLVAVARALAAAPDSAPEVVARVRAGSPL